MPFRIKPLAAFRVLLSGIFILFSPVASADETDIPAAAARFLTQSTFGPTSAGIVELQAMPSFDAWLTDQFAQPASLQEAYVRSRCPEVEGSAACGADTWVPSRHDAWWINVVDGDDQLRQRVAFALSQIFVVSDKAPALSDTQFGMASYYDMLAQHAFGNYRDLLEAVTLHPVMGIYLSMVRNRKAEPALNIRPDENYAREVLQLFSVGVHLLNPDGSLKLDGNGNPIPSYNQETIKNFARVFTGWNYANIGWDDWFGDADRTIPMVPFEQYHDTGSKTLLDGEIIPAGNTAEQDLSLALDNIASHPNVGPFITKLLIKRLVTSNPTPAYVQRVSTVFDDNGTGVRGDLKAVVRAILLDEEARNGPTLMPDSFGKLKEPLLRVSHILRAFNASKVDGGEWGGFPGTYVYRMAEDTYTLEGVLGQAVLRSPSVFNFYLPDFSPSGQIRNAGLVSPEFQIVNETSVATIANMQNAMIFWAEPGNTWASSLDLSVEQALAPDPDALLDHLNLLLLNGQMTPELRQIIKDHLNTAWYPDPPDGNRAKAKDVISLIMMSPEYQVQK